MLHRMGTTLLCIALLSGCSKTTHPDVLPALSTEQYLNLANTATPTQKPTYQLAAANELVKNQNTAQAQQIIDTITTPLSPANQVQKQLIEAKVAFINGTPQAALATLNAIDTTKIPLTSTETIDSYQLKAKVYDALGDANASIAERMTLQPLLTDPEAAHLNLITIWRTLRNLPNNALQTLLKGDESTDFIGWVQLALITKQASSPSTLIQNIREWKAQYPHHLAITLLPKNISDELISTPKPQNIALLLPLHGPLATTGHAIYNGFLAAYYNDATHQTAIPNIKTYDTSSGSITALYKRAVSEGATFVIGPLTKTHLQTLIQSDNLTVPTLALNTVLNAPHDSNLFQFGLSPLDEAQQAAERTQKLGYTHIAIIRKEAPWSADIASVFQTTWKNNESETDTTTIDELTYTNSDSLTEKIQHLLGVDLAQNNYKKLKKLLGIRLRFIPRRRKDIEMIYLIAEPTYARQIVPLLKYYYAGSIPVYTTSLVYNGINNTKADYDLDGTYFPDMPWVINPNNISPALQNLREQIKTIWPSNYSSHKKLYALGIDTYTIINKLQEMKALPQFAIDGATGALYLDSAQHIYRKLLWAHFKAGTPVLLN